MKVRASYTLEATFLVTITIWIIVCICYGGMYVHDTLILESVANEALASRIAADTEEKQWDKEIKKEIDETLFFINVSSVNVESKLAAYEIEVHGSYAVFGKKRKYTYKTQRENVNPTKYKWDYDILKGEET